MENEPELIRDQMQETRTALTEKLDTLQQKVADTVESITDPVTETVETVKDAVSDTVESVKETVSETVESVKQTFDLHRQVARHPWACVLGSVAAGFVLGRLLPLGGQRSRYAEPVVRERKYAGMAASEYNGNRPLMEPEKQEPAEPGPLSGLAQAFHGEMDKLKSLGVSLGVGLFRDLLTQSLHGELGERLKEWMNGMTEKMGGKPFTEPVVATEESPSESTSVPSQEMKKAGEGEQGRGTRGNAKTTTSQTKRW